MRNRILVLLIALAVIVGFAAARYSQAQAGPQGEAARTNQFAGGNDHTGAIPSVLPPEGWKPCPRCQNQKDRTDSAAKDKVEGHPFNPHDLTGVWLNCQGCFQNPPPMTTGQEEICRTFRRRETESTHNKKTPG